MGRPVRLSAAFMAPTLSNGPLQPSNLRKASAQSAEETRRGALGWGQGAWAPGRRGAGAGAGARAGARGRAGAGVGRGRGRLRTSRSRPPRRPTARHPGRRSCPSDTGRPCCSQAPCRPWRSGRSGCSTGPSPSRRLCSSPRSVSFEARGGVEGGSGVAMAMGGRGVLTRTHPELEAQGVDALAEPRHAVRVARGVDDELALRVAPLRAVSAVEVDVLVACHAQLGGHDLGDLDDDRLVEVVAATIIGGGASRPGERQLAAARAADAEAIPRCGGRGSQRRAPGGCGCAERRAHGSSPSAGLWPGRCRVRGPIR